MKSVVVAVIAIFILIGCRSTNEKALQSTDWSHVKIKTKSLDVDDKVLIGNTGYVMYYNMNKVMFIQDKNNEITFQANNKDYSAMIIYERGKISMDRITDMLYGGIKSGFPGAKLEKDEVVIVNGIIVKSCIVSFNAEGMKMKMMTYLLSGNSGTIQIRAGATDDVFDSVKMDIEDFINGFAKDDAS